MQAPTQPFRLPMMLTFLESSDDRHVVHSLDFDIVSVADTKEEAWTKLRLAVQTYVDFGLSNGLKDEIMFLAPREFWNKITPETPTRIIDPLVLSDGETRIVAVVDESRRAA